MLISDVEAERRLKSSKNLMNVLGVVAEIKVVTPVQIQDIPKRTNTPPLKSESLRVVAGTQAHFDSAKNVAESLGITTQQVKSAKNSESASIRSNVERSVEAVQELALLRTLEALELLERSNMINEKPRDVAAIAANMSKVYSNVRRDATASPGAVQFLVYAPVLKHENHYETIEAGVA